MAILPYIPTDVWGRFRALYEALNAERAFWEGAGSLRFAAVAAITCHGEPEDIAAAIRDRADALKRRAGWFTDLRSEIRFVVAALLAQRLANVDAFMDEVERVRGLFRTVKLRRGGVYETLAILVLHLQAGGDPLALDTVQRFQSLYEELKRYHWWLTGPDDFPCCALLSAQPGHPHEIGRRAEDCFQALSAKGFKAGDPLQTAANLLAASELPADLAAERYKGLADAFRSADVAIWQTDYDELAILAYLKHPIERIVERTLTFRAEVASLKPVMDRFMTFNLGAALAFCELVAHDGDMQRITDVKALADMQALLNAQAAVAVTAAATAAVASGASSSH